VLYSHVVFTIPDDLNPLAIGNKRVVYKILFAAASETLKQIARDPKHLGAEIAFTAVLHTWGQNMTLHPHLHCVVTGGGLAPDGKRWVSGRERYFLPVKVLGKLFRGKFLDALHRAWKKRELALGGSTAELSDPVAWSALKDRLYRKNWVVYAKRPFGGPEQVFSYLGRYTHRVAISNHRIVDFADRKVTFTVKDYRDGAQKKRMTLDAVEFLRRFMLHVLPRGFVRIRHYGLCAGPNVNTKLAAAKKLLEPNEPSETAIATETEDPNHITWWERFRDLTGIDVMVCSRCGGRLVRRYILTAGSPATTMPPNARAPPVAA